MGVGPAADEFLPAGVGEAGGFNAERCCDFVHGCVEILGHFGERVVFEGLVFSEGIVAGAGVIFAVMSDFVAGCVGGFPGCKALRVIGGEDVEGGFYLEFVEEGDAGVNLGVTGIVEGKGEGGSLAVRRGEGIGAS